MNCAADISRGGRNDTDQHRKKKKHINNVVPNTKNEKNKVDFFFLNKNGVTTVECLFMAFLMEHNLPLSYANHIRSLLREIFRKHEITKNYSYTCRKTRATVTETALTSHIALIATLQNHPFCLA